MILFGIGLFPPRECTHGFLADHIAGAKQSMRVNLAEHTCTHPELLDVIETG